MIFALALIAFAAVFISGQAFLLRMDTIGWDRPLREAFRRQTVAVAASTDDAAIRAARTAEAIHWIETLGDYDKGHALNARLWHVEA